MERASSRISSKAAKQSCPDWVFVIIAKVVVRGKEDSEIIIGHREGKGMTGWGRKKNKWICSKRGFFNRFLELRLLEWWLGVSSAGI